MSTDERELTLYWAERRVREIQTKLYRWAVDEPHRGFDDLYNLVRGPAFLLVAWDRVRGNKGARTAGVDGQTAHYIEAVRGVEGFLEERRGGVKACSFRPLPVWERMIPKANGELRCLGVPAVRGRVVQAALKLVVEPIFEAGFLALLLYMWMAGVWYGSFRLTGPQASMTVARAASAVWKP